MSLKRRVEKIEERLDAVDQLPACLLTFSDADEKQKIEAFLAENPGQPYEIIPVRFIKPPGHR